MSAKVLAKVVDVELAMVADAAKEYESIITEDDAPQIGADLNSGPPTLSSIRKLCRLGQGDVGNVFLVRDQRTESLYAVKVIKKKDIQDRNKTHRVKLERDILAAADHPFICKGKSSYVSAVAQRCPVPLPP